MRRGLPMYFAFLLLLASTAFTQDHGRLGVTVQTQPESPSPAGPAVGAKVIVVHWTHSQLHPQMVQDQVATTDANGTCTIDLPVGTSFRRQMLFPADHPNYAGDVGIGPNPKLAQRVKEADLLILAGGRLSEMPSSSYTLVNIPTPKQQLVHVHAGAEELGRVYQPALAVHASAQASPFFTSWNTIAVVMGCVSVSKLAECWPVAPGHGI